MSDGIVLWLPDNKMVTGMASISPQGIAVYKVKGNSVGVVILVILIIIAGMSLGVVLSISNVLPQGISGSVLTGAIGGGAAVWITNYNNQAKKKRLESSQASAELLYQIQMAQIANANRARFRLNPNAYYITMLDGTQFICIFNEPEKTCMYLDTLLSRRQELESNG